MIVPSAALSVLVLVLPVAQAKSTLACYEAPGGREMTCIDAAAVTINGNVRAAPMYSGGPKGVTKASSIMLVDCDRQVMTLQDRRGVNFAGGDVASSRVSRALGAWICAAPTPKRDPKLRQF